MGGRLHLFVCLLGGIISHALGSRPRQEDALPRIAEHPSDLIVLRGEPATLNCKAEGRPAPTVEWYKDGERVEIGKDDHRTLLHTGSLFFLRVQHTRRTKTDEGSYVCVARNYLGEAVSRNASLHIAMLRDDFRQQPADVVAAAGEAAMLECVPPRGHPEPTVSWKKDGVILRGGNDAVRINGGRLSISEVRRSDGGEYVCVATNSVGVRESKPAQLFVKERPTFVRKPLNQLVAANGSVEFNCEAQGDPRPDVSWTKLRGELPRDRHEVKADNTLRIWLARPSDAGTYTCVASSQLGRAEVSASLNVHVGPYASPQLVVQPRDQVVEEGQTATFHCLAAGNPPPSVFWQREGTQNLLFPNQPLQSSNRLWVSPSGDLTVSDVRPSDAGYYICHSLSVAGSVVAKAYLDVTDVTLENLPPIARQVAVNQTVPAARSVVLPCQAVGGGGGGGGATTPTIVYWLKGGTRIPSQDGRMSWQEGRGLQISYTRVEDTGIYTCVISNANGETSWNTFLEVKEGKRYTEMNAALAPRGPSRPEIVEVSRNTVTLSWKRDTLQPATSYIIEAFSRSLGKGWKIVAEGVRSETFTVRSLRQGAIFVFLVRAVNLHGASEPSAVSEPVRTEDPSPAEPGLDSALIQKELGRISIRLQDPVTLSSTALRLHWTVMQRPLYLQGFRVLYRPLPSSRPASGNWSVLEVRSPLEHGAVLSRLRKGFSYEAKVRAFFNGFQGPDSEARRGSTFEEAPSASPQHVEVKRCEEPGCDSITVTWQPPQEELQNGVILEYKLWCMGNSSELHINRTVEASSRSAVLRPIVPGVMYRITVAAVNSAGTGLRSPFTVLAPVASSSSSQFGTFVKTPVFIAVVVLVLIVLIGISIVVYCCCCRKRSSPDPYQGATKDPSFTFTPTVTFNPKDDTSMMSNASYPPFGGPGQTWTEPWQNAALNQNSPSQAIPDYCRPADHLSPFRNQLEQKETNLHRPRTPETPVYREVEPAHQLSGTQNFPGPRIKECQVLGKTSAYAASPPAQAALCNNMSSTARVTDKRTHKQPFLPRADGLPGTKNHMIEVTKLNNELAMTDGRGEAVAHHSTPEQSTMGSHASSERSSSSAHSGKRKNARTPKTGRQAAPGVAEPLPPPPALPPAELGSAGRAAQAEHERVDEGSGYPPERAYEYLQQNEEEHDEDDEEADEEDDLVVDEGKARGPQQYARASYSLQSTAPCSPASPEERRPMIQAHSHEPPGRRKRAALERAARHYPGRPLLSARSPSPPCLYGYITGPMPSDLETEPAEEEEEEEAAVAVASAGTVSVFPKAGTVGAARFDAKKLLLSLEHTSVSSLGDPESSLAGSMLNGWGSASEGDGDDEDGGGSSDGGGGGGGGGGGSAGDGGYGYRARNSGGSDYGYKAKDDFGVNYGYRGKNGSDRGYDRGRDQRGPPGKARGFSAGAPWEKSGERGPWRRSDPVSGHRSEDAGDGDMLFGIAPVHMALLHGHREFRRLLLNRKRNPERPELQELLRLAAERGIETELVNRRQLDELSEGRPNQGVCLEASRRDFMDYDALFAGSADVVSAGAAEVAPASQGEPEPAGGGEESSDRQAEDPVKAEVATDDPAAGSPASETVADGGKRRLWVVINEVNDPMNLGAVLRSTYFMGVETVLITKQNSCSLTPTVSKASAGTVEVMDIYTTGRLPQVLQEKAKQGWQIVGTVGYAKSTGSAVPVVPCDQYQLKAPTILLIGNEGYGLPQELLALCDVLLTIEPRRELHRGIESLNLSVATGILLYNLLGKAAEGKQE